MAAAADSPDAALQGDSAPAWDSDEEPQQSDGSFAVADLLIGFAGSGFRANGSSMRHEKADDRDESAVRPSVGAQSAEDLLGDLGAPTQVSSVKQKDSEVKEASMLQEQQTRNCPVTAG